MSTFLDRWGPDIVDFLKLSVRQNEFDFDKVARLIQNYCIENGREYLVKSIDASSCRECFAEDFYSENNPNTCRPEESAKPLRPLDDLSFDEMMEVISNMEEENIRKKEKIFARVLSSLSNGEVDNTNDIKSFTDAETSLFLSTIEKERENKSLNKQKQIETMKQTEERKRLEIEREQLRRRFDVGSADAEGIDPLPLSNALSTLNESINNDGNIINVDVEGFDIHEVLESKEFDAILEALEEELSLQAPNKSSLDGNGMYCMSSDLQDVLDILDKAANDNHNKNNAKTSALRTVSPNVHANKTTPSFNVKDISSNSNTYVLDTNINYSAQSKTSSTKTNIATSSSSSSHTGVTQQQHHQGQMQYQLPPQQQQQGQSQHSSNSSNAKQRRHLDFSSSSSSSSTDNAIEDSNAMDMDEGEDYSSSWTSSRSSLKTRAVTATGSSTSPHSQQGREQQQPLEMRTHANVWKAFGQTSTDFNSLLRKKSNVDEYEVSSYNSNHPNVSMTSEEGEDEGEEDFEIGLNDDNDDNNSSGAGIGHTTVPEEEESRSSLVIMPLVEISRSLEGIKKVVVLDENNGTGTWSPMHVVPEEDEDAPLAKCVHKEIHVNTAVAVEETVLSGSLSRSRKSSDNNANTNSTSSNSTSSSSKRFPFQSPIKSHLKPKY